jgi:hypothetical protein
MFSGLPPALARGGDDGEVRVIAPLLPDFDAS